jgi:hypothetical protein
MSKSIKSDLLSAEILLNYDSTDEKIYLPDEQQTNIGVIPRLSG